MRDLRHTGGLDFVKMHGAGNHFVVIDSRGSRARMTPALARAIGDPRRGVGFDQLVEIRDAERPERGADLALDFWNVDGSRSGACGNATRCVAHRLMAATGAERLTIRTGARLLHAARGSDGGIAVNMGPPHFGWRDVPLSAPADTEALPLPGGPAALSMGNPHCVLVVPDAEAADVARDGPRLAADPLFAESANVGFVSLAGPDRLRMRVWERGTGITLACGSGACAAAVVACRRGLSGPDVAIDADGGRLHVAWRADGVWLTGPVATVFEGRLGAELAAAP